MNQEDMPPLSGSLSGLAEHPPASAGSKLWQVTASWGSFPVLLS